MRLVIDNLVGWTLTKTAQDRRYYCHSDRLALMVCRNDLRLENTAGLTVDAAVGWDDGWPEFVLYPGRRHTKITVFRLIDDIDDGKATPLSVILQAAPEIADEGVRLSE